MSVYICVCMMYVHNQGIREFFGLKLKKEMVVLENKPWWRKQRQIVSTNGITLDKQANYMVNSCQGGCRVHDWS